MQLSIIIVNYNVKYFLEQCLCSVLKACRNIDVEIFVVDNCSTDSSKEFFANKFPSVQFIWKSDNVGFAKANNEALKQATGERILFLNPDTILPEDGLENSLQFFNAQNNIGALGIRMIDGSGSYLPESKRGFPTAFTSFCKMTGLTALFPKSKLFARYYLGHLPADKNQEVDVLAGACMMVDKKVLDEVGSFDEDFFMYAEDIDLSYRIQKAGFRNYYFAESSIIHFKGESTRKMDSRYVKIFYGAMLLFVKKHYSKGAASLYGLMLQAAIKLKMLAAIINNMFAKKSNPDKKSSKSSAAIIADAETFNQLQQGLQQQFSELKRIEKIDQLKQPVDVVILSETALSFNAMIQLMEAQSGQYEFFIHVQDSHSVVGSSDKNSSGKVYSY